MRTVPTPGRATLADYRALIEKTQRLRVCRDPKALAAARHLEAYEVRLGRLLELGMAEDSRLRALEERDRDARAHAPAEQRGAA